MKHSTARVVDDFHSVLGLALISRLNQLGGFILTSAVSDTHVHMLVKLPTDQADAWLSLAKKHAWFEMRDAGWQKKLWAKKGKIVRIRDKAHQRNCFAYIIKHLHQGAWIWVWKGINNKVVDRILQQP